MSRRLGRWTTPVRWVHAAGVLAMAVAAVIAVPAAAGHALPQAKIVIRLDFDPHAGAVLVGTPVTVTATVEGLPATGRIVILRKGVDKPGQKTVKFWCGVGKSSCVLGWTPKKAAKIVVQVAVVVDNKVVARSSVFDVSWVPKAAPPPPPKPTPTPTPTTTPSRREVFTLFNTTVERAPPPGWTIQWAEGGKAVGGTAKETTPGWECEYTWQVPPALVLGENEISLSINIRRNTSNNILLRQIAVGGIEGIRESPNTDLQVLTQVNQGGQGSRTLHLVVPKGALDPNQVPVGSKRYLRVGMLDGPVILYTYKKD